MVQKFVIILIICLLSDFGVMQDIDYPFEDCGSETDLANLTNFRIDECINVNGTCAIHHSFNFSVSIYFEMKDKPLRKVKASVRATILNIDFELELDNDDACDNLQFKKKCPLRPNTSYKYWKKVCTWDVPRYKTILRWYLKDEQYGRVVVCAQTTFLIT